MSHDDRRRVAFITGAASGIGRATAELFAGEGWWIGAADRNAAGLDELRTDRGAQGCLGLIPATLPVPGRPGKDPIMLGS